MSSFKEIGLKPEILKALDELGFENPTPIQEECIPFLLEEKRDLTALAQTGTGKTAAFSLPILEQLDALSPHIQAIILCPTRELCLQICRDIDSYKKYLGNVSAVAIYGGARIDEQLRALQKRPQIVVGTPGRVLDFVTRKRLILDQIRWLVLDEADEMLNMGFKDDLEAILSQTPEKRQTLLFSATMPRTIQGIAQKYMKDPERIEAGKVNQGAETLKHFYTMVHARDRYKALRRLIDQDPEMVGIIFCRTRNETQELANQLGQDHYRAEAIHGDLSQEQRSKVMERLRRHHLQFLVATDVAARGIDVSHLSHVIHFSLPDQMESYVHRSGRTGRANRTGTSIVLVHMREVGKLRTLSKVYGITFEAKPVPSGVSLLKERSARWVKQMQSQEPLEGPFVKEIKDTLNEMDVDQLKDALVRSAMGPMIAEYQNAPDLNVREGRIDTHPSEHREPRDPMRRDSKGPRTGGGSITFARFRVSLGKADKFGPKGLFEVINKGHELRGIEIGQIRVFDKDTEFEADQRYLQAMQAYFRNAQFRGRQIRLELLK